MYLLKFKDMDCWIAPWNGDPGRTLRKENAKLFETKKEAERFKKKVLKKNYNREINLVLEEL